MKKKDNFVSESPNFEPELQETNLKQQIEELQAQVQLYENQSALRKEEVRWNYLLNILNQTNEYLKGIGQALTNIGQVLEEKE